MLNNNEKTVDSCYSVLIIGILRMKKEHWLIISDQIKIKHFMTDTGRKVYTTDLLKLFELSQIKTFSVEKLNFFHLTGNYFLP